MSHDSLWLEATKETIAGYRRMIDASVAQLTDDQLFARPQQGINSVATLLRHLGGNLQSRWTNFLTEDGEKPDRQRELEFADWEGSRDELIQYFDAGWKQLEATLDSLTVEQLAQTVAIRGESHTVPQAIQRSLTHLAYHAGQILLIARIVHGDDQSWQWLTIKPGESQRHNESTWGTPASWGAAGKR